MQLAAWYHIYAGGSWRAPLREYQAALADFPGRMCYGVVGSRPQRDEAWKWCENRGHFEAEQPTGNESVTLNALRAYAATHDGAVLYAHTKGAATVSAFRDRWRRSMTSRVVANWRANLNMISTVGQWGEPQAQAIGCHWLTEAEYPGMFGPMTVPAEGSGFFGGNFWMARCDYLRTLPPCPAEPRWEAERWIGLNGPRVVDLLPGWPHDNRWPELCGG